MIEQPASRRAYFLLLVATQYAKDYVGPFAASAELFREAVTRELRVAALSPQESDALLREANAFLEQDQMVGWDAAEELSAIVGGQR